MQSLPPGPSHLLLPALRPKPSREKVMGLLGGMQIDMLEGIVPRDRSKVTSLGQVVALVRNSFQRASLLFPALDPTLSANGPTSGLFYSVLLGRGMLSTMALHCMHLSFLNCVAGEVLLSERRSNAPASVPGGAAACASKCAIMMMLLQGRHRPGFLNNRLCEQGSMKLGRIGCGWCGPERLPPFSPET